MLILENCLSSQYLKCSSFTHLYVANQAVSTWLNRQYEEISHGTTNGPPGRMLRIILPIIDVLIIKLPNWLNMEHEKLTHY